MSAGDVTLTDAERAEVRELLDLHVLADDEGPVWSLVAAIKAEAYAAGLAARTPTATGDTECRWCPPGCPSCEPDDCECYRHQDWPDKTTDPSWPYLTATGDDLRDRVTALAEASERDGRGGVWVHDAWFTTVLAAPSAPVVSRPEAVVKTLEDFRDHGLRCDLNPTMRHDYGLYAAFVDYLRSADENVRARAARALEADSDAP